MPRQYKGYGPLGRRYKLVEGAEFRERDRYLINAVAEIIVEEADVVDTKGGGVWPNGAQRVRVVMYTKDIAKPRTQTKVGESAWSWADRTAQDLHEQLRHEAYDGRLNFGR